MRLVTAAAIAALTLGSTHPALAILDAATANAIDVLGAEAAAFAMAAETEPEPGRKGRLLFLADLALDRIKSRFPDGPDAAEMTFGRFRSLDVGTIDRGAKAWEAANVEEARRMRAAEGALAARLVGDKAGGPAPATPDFSARAPAVPSFKAASPVAPTAQAAAPTTIEQGKSLQRSELVERLKASVVVILSPETANLGTGFFVTPRHIITNSHVVEGADRYVVANRSIAVKAAKVIARGQTQGGVGIDTAILETDGWTAPGFLPFAASVEEGSGIVIAGFPGRAATGLDRAYDNFLNLIANNRLPSTDQIPTAKFDFGYVQSVFTDAKTGLLNVQEGLNTSGGNSGSPVINYCGEVVAQHYSATVAKLQVAQGTAYGDSSKFNYAIASVEVVKFLRSVGVPIVANSGACGSN